MLAIHSNDFLSVVSPLVMLTTVSTGIRFTTLPDASPPSFIQDTLSPNGSLGSVSNLFPSSLSSSLISPSSPSLSSTSASHSPTSHSQPHAQQPPTTITAIFNPLTGHFISAYAARVSRDLTLCSRFSFNINSYESEWVMGGEWWIRRNNMSSLMQTNGTRGSEDMDSVGQDSDIMGSKSRTHEEKEIAEQIVGGGLKLGRHSLINLRDRESADVVDSPPYALNPLPSSSASIPISPSSSSATSPNQVGEIQGVIKAKLSTSGVCLTIPSIHS